MAPRKSTTARAQTGNGPTNRGLSFDTLSRIGSQFGVPALAGLSEESLEALPVDTLYTVVVENHWLLCLKGRHRHLVFDSLGLPPNAIQHMFGQVPFDNWNVWGYQSMFGTVCGYYIVGILIAIQRGDLLHNATVDDVLQHICKYKAPRTASMAEWYNWHRHHTEKLKQNDHAIVRYVNEVYPHLGWLDFTLPSLGPADNNSGMLGSPLYHRAGVNAASVHQRYSGLKAVLENDPQRDLLSHPNTVVSLATQRPRLVNSNQIAQATAAGVLARHAVARLLAQQDTLKDSLRPHPDLGRRLTNDERILYARTARNAFNPPSGTSAAGNQGPVDAQPNPGNNVPPPPPPRPAPAARPAQDINSDDEDEYHDPDERPVGHRDLADQVREIGEQALNPEFEAIVRRGRNERANPFGQLRDAVADARAMAGDAPDQLRRP